MQDTVMRCLPLERRFASLAPDKEPGGFRLGRVCVPHARDTPDFLQCAGKRLEDDRTEICAVRRSGPSRGRFACSSATVEGCAAERKQPLPARGVIVRQQVPFGGNVVNHGARLEQVRPGSDWKRGQWHCAERTVRNDEYPSGLSERGYEGIPDYSPQRGTRSAGRR